MNFFKKLFGKKEKPEPPKRITGNEHFQDYSDIVDDFPSLSPFQVGVIYNNRGDKKQKKDQQ